MEATWDKRKFGGIVTTEGAGLGKITDWGYIPENKKRGEVVTTGTDPEENNPLGDINGSSFSKIYR